MPEPTQTPVPAGYHTINPYLTVEDVPAMISFLRNTFDGVLTEEIRQADGRIAHTEVRIGDTVLMLGGPQVDAPLPSHAQSRTGTFYVYVASVDETYRRAMSCGGNSWQAPTDVFYGDRVAAVVDSNDNVWWIATKQRQLSEQELQTAASRQWAE